MTIMTSLCPGLGIALLLLCCSVLCSAANGTSDVQDVINVHRKLLQYTEIVKPGAFNETVHIQVRLLPTYLKELDTAKQIFSIVGMMYFAWNHESLTWNPDDYGGVPEVALPADKIWKPQFEILNSAVSNVFDDTILKKHPVNVRSNGWASWLVSEEFTTTCDINPEYFPFDIQTCALHIFGKSTIKSGSYENFTQYGVDPREFMKSTEWTLLETSASNLVIPFRQMRFTFKFQRAAEFYIVTMVIPLVALSVLGLLMFPLPAESGEKISLGMACLLSFVVIQTSLTPYLPTSYTTMPYIIMITFALMIINSLAVASTITLISVLGMEPLPRLPHWLDKLATKSAKAGVQKNPNLKDPVMKLDDADSNQGSQSAQEQEQLNEKWKKIANTINRFLFLIFSITLILLLCAILAVWILGANSAS